MKGFVGRFVFGRGRGGGEEGGRRCCGWVFE